MVKAYAFYASLGELVTISFKSLLHVIWRKSPLEDVLKLKLSNNNWSYHKVPHTLWLVNLVKSKEMIWLKGIYNVFSSLLLWAYFNSTFSTCYWCLLEMQTIFFLESVDNIFLLETPVA